MSRNVLMAIHNVPNDAKRYLICRFSAGKLWYWDSKDTEREARNVCSRLGNAVIVEDKEEGEAIGYS